MSAVHEGVRWADFDAATEILRMLTIDGVDSTGDPSMLVVERDTEAFWGMTADR
jgi:hypothetical protein